MKTNTHLFATVFLLSALTAFSPVHAVPSVNDGDIFLGIRDKTATKTYVIDLGLFDLFYNASTGHLNLNSASFGVTSATLVTDLNTYIGAGWYNNANVVYGVFGGYQAGSSSAIPSLPDNAIIIGDTTANAVGNIADQTANTLTGYASSIGGSVATNVGVSSAWVNANGAGTWDGYQYGGTANAANGFGSSAYGNWTYSQETAISNTLNINTVFSSAPAFNNGFQGAKIGTFAIDASGNLNFTALVASSSTNVWATNSGNLSTISITNNSNLVFAGSGGLVTNDQVSSLSGITFSNSVSAGYTLSGSNIAIGASGIVNNSSSNQTVATGLTLSAPQTFNAASGNLIVSGAITNGGNTLTIAGAKNTTLSGAIAGLGGLTMGGTGTTTLSAVSTFSGNTLVSSGTLLIAGYGNTNSAVTVGSSSVLNGINAGGPATLGSVTVTNGGSLALSNAVTDGTLYVKSLSLASNALSSFDLKSTNNYSSLNASGNIALGGALTLAIQGLYNNTNNQGLFQVYTSGGAITGNFSSVNLTGSYTGTLSYYSNNNTWQLWSGSGTNSFYAGINLNSGLVTVIPEPSTYALFVVGTVMAIIILRRSKSNS